MDAYLFDTNFISILYNPRRPEYPAVQAAAAALDVRSPQYISVVVLAELRFGLTAAEITGQHLAHIRYTIEQAEARPLANLNLHTAEAYGKVKAQLAAHWVDLSRKLPRWPEDWRDRVSGQSLQVDENDLWLVAQAIERNYVLVTTDQRLANRFQPAVPDLRVRLVIPV
jgi:tRNA(fMet)-specific endonuclease VapC